jgi:ketosteroid isomerase-like protein
VYESWNTEGVSALEPWLTDDVELHDAPEMPDARTWHGVASVLARLDEVAATVGGGWAELREFADFGDRVLVHMVWREEEGLDAPVLAEVTHVVTVEGDRIAAMQVFLDRDAAAAAARV